MNIDLSGKRALVTGSTSGIGFATARQLAESGASVIVNGRSQEKVDSAVGRITAEFPHAQVVGSVADLAHADGCDALLSAHPEVDILINNMGIFQLQDFFEIADSEWTRFFETNVMSGIRLSRAYAPRMVAKGWGRIVFVSSESALNIPRDMVHYGFTKTAQLAVSRGLAKRLAGTGVTVNSVLPGPTLSEGVADMLKEDATASGETVEAVATRFVKTHRASSIIERAASVEEVANMIVYVSSPLASATTGAALRVDGGVVDTIA
ncbi:oxidoreductase [Paraburkholderia monticola]|uniref:Oxidoreductase n=1 Tax=Paraburkholderia monticola TaxID=1399968 RepID=A0A149PV56_9BURK|nr:SDR family NAD(P)-dependent oxidoreductase [Paraburkholderia monticola]KXU88826.1 oxidoreductase [Paraburkholderia monticola]